MTSAYRSPQDPLAELARTFDTCVLSDAMDAAGVAGVLDGLVPMWQGATLAGRVVTMKLAEGPAPAGSTPVHLGARAIMAAHPSDVIVIDNGGRSSMGSWGGLLSLAAALHGVAGVVTDGACRDVDEARELHFPVFARAAAVRTARSRIHEQSVGQPISVCGVTVSTCDLIVADGSGVVIVPNEQAEAVLTLAKSFTRREAVMQQKLRDGTPVDEVLGASYEDMLSPGPGH